MFQRAKMRMFFSGSSSGWISFCMVPDLYHHCLIHEPFWNSVVAMHSKCDTQHLTLVGGTIRIFFHVYMNLCVYFWRFIIWWAVSLPRCDTCWTSAALTQTWTPKGCLGGFSFLIKALQRCSCFLKESRCRKRERSDQKQPWAKEMA